MKYAVKELKVRDAIFITGLGDLGRSLPPPKARGMILTLTEDGVVLSHKGILAIIPLSNVIVADGISAIVAENVTRVGK